MAASRRRDGNLARVNAGSLVSGYGINPGERYRWLRPSLCYRLKDKQTDLMGISETELPDLMRSCPME